MRYLAFGLAILALFWGFPATSQYPSVFFGGLYAANAGLSVSFGWDGGYMLLEAILPAFVTAEEGGILISLPACISIFNTQIAVDAAFPIFASWTADRYVPSSLRLGCGIVFTPLGETVGFRFFSITRINQLDVVMGGLVTRLDQEDVPPLAVDPFLSLRLKF